MTTEPGQLGPKGAAQLSQSAARRVVVTDTTFPIFRYASLSCSGAASACVREWLRHRASMEARASAMDCLTAAAGAETATAPLHRASWCSGYQRVEAGAEAEAELAAPSPATSSVCASQCASVDMAAARWLQTDAGTNLGGWLSLLV